MIPHKWTRIPTNPDLDATNDRYHRADSWLGHIGAGIALVLLIAMLALAPAVLP